MSSALELLVMHHENMRILYPDDNLMILCECDGSLYDMRILTLHMLRSFDRAHQTSFFSLVSPEHLPVPLPDIEEVLCALGIPFGISTAIAAWYCRHRWDIDGVRQAHRPLTNVLKILTCLQMQQQTHVGLYAERAGRTEETCAAMISSLGSAHGMLCEGKSVFLDDAPFHQQPERVLRAWQHFRRLGYRPIAVIDARSEAGHATMASLDMAVEVMFLQAREIREFKRVDIADHALANPDFIPRDMLNAQFRTQAPNLAAYARSAPRSNAQAAVP